MVAPAIAAAGISAVGGLLGGIFGRKAERRAIAEQNAYNDPAAVRKRFEDAGFNPLIGVQQAGVGMQSSIGGGNFIGSAISDGVSALASAWSETATQKAEASALEVQNEKLQRRLDVQTIRPVIGGLYDSPRGVSSVTTVNSPAKNNDDYYSIYDPEADWTGQKVGLPDDDGSYNSKLGQRTVLEFGNLDTKPLDISDAEEFEKRGGDVASSLAGLGVTFGDAVNTSSIMLGNGGRGVLDRMGVTTPDKDYWTYWGQSIKDAPSVIAENVKRAAASAKPQRKSGVSFWDTFGMQY